MKLGPVTNLGKRNTSPSKKIDDDVISVNCDAIVIVSSYTNLQQSGSQISDAWSLTLSVKFSLIVTFNLT